MPLTIDEYEHRSYLGLVLLADVLRRFDYEKDTTPASLFVRTLNVDEVIALAETTTDGGWTDVRRAADYMWQHMTPRLRYSLADELQREALAVLPEQVG